MYENCPHCQQNQYMIKASFNRCRTQRYLCQACLGYFTPKPKPHSYDDAVKTKALQLYLEGHSFRGIGRLLGVHNQSVINWDKCGSH